MTWLGMSIPTLPGSLKKPRTQHPGARNIEESEKEQPPLPPAIKPKKKPAVNPAQPQSPRPSVRKPSKGN